MLQTFRPA